MINILAGQLALSPIGYIVVGMLFAIAGIALIVFTSEVPIVNMLTSIIGFGAIVMGGLVMLYGVSPRLVLTIGAGAGFIIWIVGVAIIIWHEVVVGRPRRGESE